MISKSRSLISAGRASVFVTLILALGAGWAWHSLRPVSAVGNTTWTVGGAGPFDCTVSVPNCTTISAAVGAATVGDTINVVAGTYNESNILINKNLTINGAGANTTIVDAQQMGRVFFIDFQTSVFISGLTIKGGSTAAALPNATSKNRTTAKVAGPRTQVNAIDGGGIYNLGTLSLNSCTVRDNMTAAGSAIIFQQPQKAGQRFAHIVRSGPAIQLQGLQGGNGGGIYNGGLLVVKSCTVSNNSTGAGADSDPLAISAIVGNGGGGGGIYNGFFQTLEVSNSTIAANRTGRGGNIVPNCNPLAPLGDGPPVPGNGGEGGGIANHGALSLGNSTIADNEAGAAGRVLNCPSVAPETPRVPVAATGGNGGGVYSADTQATAPGSILGMTAISTIIANNQLREPENASGPDIYNGMQVVSSQGYNLIGIADGSNGFTQPTDHKGTGAAPLNPGLGPLTDNGGPTQTMALLANSPAVDNGFACTAVEGKPNRSPRGLCGLILDQRGDGFPRTFDHPGLPNAADGTDVGAFEAQTVFPCRPDVTPPVIICPGSITKFTDSGQSSATVNPGTPVATDNCVIFSRDGTSNLTVTGMRSDGKPLNAPYPVGVTIITWKATDGGGNMATCTQSIAVMIPSGQRKRIGGL